MKFVRFKLSKRRVLLLAIVLLIALGWLTFKLLSSPSEGSINYPGSSDSAGRTAESYTRHDGEYISFAYPESYRFETRQDSSNAVLESYFLVAPAKGRNPSFTVGISVYLLPNPNLEENSSYKIRNQAPQSYKKTVGAVGGREVIYFKNDSSREKAAFIQNGLKLAAIAISGAGYNSETEEDFQQLISSLQWL